VRAFHAPASLEITERIVGTLLNRYGSGLVRPLHFFPETSLAYAVAAIKAGEREESSVDGLRAALRAWHPNDFSRSVKESEDPWNSLVHGDRPPLDDQFSEIAIEFFEPLLAHLDGDLP
jgi:exodeoxyribonuclease V gamma subunit